LSMKLIFAGTPEFAACALQALLDAGHDIALVLTQPDRPAGRGMKLQASPVKQLAVKHGIAVAQPMSLKLDGKYPQEASAAQQAIAAVQADAMIVAAYGLILPQWALSAPRLGCLNIHASLLPRWRGAAPIHRAIEAGDAETGITIMQMDVGLDTGDMLLVRTLPIALDATTASLHDQLATLGGQAIVHALAHYGDLPHVKQPHEGITYAHKIEKHEGLIDWSQSAEQIARKVRAFNPFPGASTTLNGETLKIWNCSTIDSTQTVAPGTVVFADPVRGVGIASSDGLLMATELQRPGGKRLAVDPFLQGHPIETGAMLGR
jgi:methionyl-tRNA formyltransferase